MNEENFEITEQAGSVRSSELLGGREASGQRSTGRGEASPDGRPACCLDGYPCTEDCNLKPYCEFRANEHAGASAGAQRDASEPSNTEGSRGRAKP